jgi:hypothetical protein
MVTYGGKVAAAKYKSCNIKQSKSDRINSILKVTC